MSEDSPPSSAPAKGATGGTVRRMDDDAIERVPGTGAPARRELAAAGYTRLGQLDGMSARELLKIHGVGPKAIRVLRAAMRERGLTLRE